MRKYWLQLAALGFGLLSAGQLRAADPVPPANTPCLPIMVPSPQGWVLSPSPPAVSLTIVPTDGSFMLAGRGDECAECAKHGSHMAKHHALCSRFYYKYIEPDCGLVGCPWPVGCSNFHLEFLHLFGSCREFFGTGAAAPPSLISPP
jgi:hypothetical protein